MIYRPLGNTGLTVSRLSYGASSLGSVFRQIDEGEGIRTVHCALDMGINFIDVAPYYGMTKAETVLGKALSSVRRHRYYLATKVGRYGQNVEDFDFSAQRVTDSVDESLQRLGVDHVDLIQCHDIEFGNLDQIIEETIPALQKVVAAGKARFIGITGLPLAVFPVVLARCPVDCVLSYCHYSLVDDSLLALLPTLRERGIGVINASPLSMGLLSHHTPPSWHPAPLELQQACTRAAAFCRDRGADIAKLAVQFSIAHRQIATTLVGTASVEEMQKNLQWADEPMDMELLEDVEKMLQPVHNTTWPSGRPENTNLENPSAIRNHPRKVADSTGLQNSL